MTRIGLVGCVKRKRRHAAPARDLYVSPLFRGRREAVEATCDRWYILSARHGLVRPDDILQPYDETLVGAAAQRKRLWSDRVLRQLDDELGPISSLTFEIHAGNDYCNFGLVEGLHDRGAQVDRPVEGLTQGQQLAYYRSRPAGDTPAAPALAASRGRNASRDRSHEARAGRRPAAPRGKYKPLYDALTAIFADRREMSFNEVETVLGASLPASARTHRPWWANDQSHSQAHAWLAAGFETEAVNLARERVTFTRA